MGEGTCRNLRKQMRGTVPESFYEALTVLGYTRCNQAGGEWRRHELHLFIRKTKKSLILRLHEDLPSPFPPFHRARHKGKKLEIELHKIEEAYKRQRAIKYDR